MARQKIVNAATKDMGSAGAQILLAKYDRINAQGVNGYLHNVVVSYLAADTDAGDLGSENVGAIFYLTSDGSWNDDLIITARAGGGNGTTVSLSARRSITSNDTDPGHELTNFGPVYLWAEVTDATATADIDIRWVAEAWGRFIQCTEFP